MRRSTRLTLAVLGAVGMLFPSMSVAEISKDYAIMARATWSAFECSSLASKSGDPIEQERLFLFGYDQGKKFIAAVQSKQVKEQDLSGEVPLMMLLLLQGPSADFMLGRVFEAAQESVLKDVYKTGEVFHDDEAQKSNAGNKFWKLNCQLIGR